MEHGLNQGVVNFVNDSMTFVMAKLENMERRMTKMDQSIHAIRVGCENCSVPHLIRDCDLDENGNWKAQVCYSSVNKYDEDWRKPKREWLTYVEYKKAKKEKYKMKTRGFFQKEEPVQEKKLDFEDMLTGLAAASEKRHNETNVAIREQQLIMKEQQALMRNQQASILNIEKQIGQLAQQVNQRATGELPGNPKKNPRIAHVSENNFYPLKPIHEVEAKVELEDAETSPESQIVTSTRQNKKIQECKKIIDHLRALQANNPFVETLLHTQKYASLLKELLTNRKNMEEVSEIVLNELPEKMGDPGSITIPCQFGNLFTTQALADSGASINIMPYSFFKKLNLPELKPMHMTIHLVDKTVVHPKGVCVDLLIKVDNCGHGRGPQDSNHPWKTIFDTACAIVDMRESTLTLKVGDDSVAFVTNQEKEHEKSIEDKTSSMELGDELLERELALLEEDNAKQYSLDKEFDAQGDLKELERLLEGVEDNFEEITSKLDEKNLKNEEELQVDENKDDKDAKVLEIEEHSFSTRLNPICQEEKRDKLTTRTKPRASEEVFTLSDDEMMIEKAIEVDKGGMDTMGHMVEERKKKYGKGTKRKCEGNDTKRRKEELKKAYKRRIHAYKMKYKAQRIKQEFPMDEAAEK
uniref:Uncharacterized protein n=1 Tax=Lactuca sativa TaxID=4236 RepID=A0A9R1XTZ2_LACSA|nr:hypothetical protein LSAT_V11C100031130 [Lactuca sativa]